MRDGGTSKALPVGKLLQKSVQRQESANSWIPYRLHSFSWEGNYLESNSMMTSGWDQSCHNCSVVDTPNVTGSIIGRIGLRLTGWKISTKALWNLWSYGGCKH
jgi:hypothetical protein